MSSSTSTPAPVPATAAPSQGFRRSAVILLGVLGAIQVTDPLISSLALVKASDALNFSASTQSLAAGISTLALAATVIPGGLLADRLGRRHVLMVSILVAAVGQILTFASPDASIYLVGRVIAGIALGITFGAAYGMLREVAAPASLGPAMATFNIVNGIIPIVGLVGTGILVSFDWRLAYLVLPILSLICFPLIPLVLPNVAKLRGGKVDLRGMTFVALGVAGLLFGISSVSGGLEKPAFWGSIVIGLVAFAAFAATEKRSKNPVFPIKLLAHPAFLGAVVMGVFWNFGAAAMSQMLPNFWQYVTHMPAGLLGMASLPMSFAGIIGSLAAGIYLGKGVASRTLSSIGYGLIVVGFVSYLLVTPGAGYLIFIPGMIVAGAGWMMNATSQGNLFISLAPATFFGPVTSSKVTVGQFGYALGLTGTTVMVSTLTLAGVDKATKGAVTGEGNWDAITSYLATGKTTNTELAAVSQSALETLYSQAFQTTSVIVAVIVALAGVVMYVFLKNKKASIPVDEFLGL